MTTGATLAGAGVSPPDGARISAPVGKGTGPDSRPSRLPLLLSVVCAALVVGGFALGAYLANLHNGLIAVAFTAVGAFVIRRRPGNRVGWLFMATGIAHAVMFFGRQYGLYSGAHEASTLPAVSWVTWMGVWPLPVVLVLTGVTLMCFPDGALPSPRWRLVVAVMAAAGALLTAVSALWPVEYADNSISVPHPFDLGGYDAVQTVWEVAGRTAYFLFQVAWVTCVVVRLRRASGDEARQLKWFVYAVAMGVVAMVVSVIAFRSPVLGVLAVPVIPVVAGAAILKYRLYDIDVVINKTLVVGAMAGIVTAAYVAVVAGAGAVIGVSASPNLALSLLATAIVAVVFEPARRRVQAWIDRLVYGNRPTPYEALARLSTQLLDGSQRGELLAGLASTVADGVGASEVTLWVGSSDDLVTVASWPPPAGEEKRLPATPTDVESLGDGGRTHVRPILLHGKLRGAITLTKAPGEVLTADEDRLLGDLVAQAGLVIDNVGLGAELQERLHQISVQAAELRAAAKRIVAAQDETRRRIERDLHDGAQQRLVTLALHLQAGADRAASSGDRELARSLEEARLQLTEALAELREMARGIHPAILTQEGLDAALHFLAERSQLPVHVAVTLDRRLPQDVEATAYFVVSEALTNAAKHSGASSVAVEGRLTDGRLLIQVSDNGVGGAEGRRGSGLQGLADRLATLDGRLTVDSAEGGGTRLRVEIPCG
ncbi:MAG TPA: sensor histidine kinase [Acidimicrobiales bacterium]|nr:sensor histidine kinase [Acidimicrobiales bacterium]